MAAIIAPIFAVIIIVIIVAALLLLKKRKKPTANLNAKQLELANKKESHIELGLDDNKNKRNTNNTNNNNSSPSDSNHELGELNLRDISVGKRLGGGNFSDVYQGIYYQSLSFGGVYIL